MNDWLQGENCFANDLDTFNNRLNQLAKEQGYINTFLDQGGEFPVLLLTSKQRNQGSNILAAAGFHGDEPAGWWGMLRFLETVHGDVLNKVNLSLIPFVNTTGILLRSRVNRWGEDPNRGFCHTPSGQPEPSKEGKVLLKNLPYLKTLCKDGFLSLHEDIEVNQFYIYSFENMDSPGQFTEALRAAESRFFKPSPDGIVEGARVRNGIAFHHCDGSFEDFLFHAGIPRTACTETPGLFSLEERIEVNAQILNAYVNFFGAVHSPGE